MDARIWLVGVVALGAAPVAFGEEGALRPAETLPRLSPTPAPPLPLPMAPRGVVGRPLPEIAEHETAAPNAEGVDLSLAPWLLPPSADPKLADIKAAFDLQGVTLKDPQLGAGAARRDQQAVFVSDVRLASAQAAAPDERTIALVARAEKLASEARSIGDLTDLLESCGGESPHAGATPRHPALAKVVAWAFNRRGELHAESGDDREAFDDFQRSVAVEPRSADALHNRGLISARYGRNEAALADFTAALEINPSFAAAQGNRGELLLAMGRAEEAEADFTRAIAAARAAAYYSGRAAARRRLGKSAEAVRDLNQALKLAPEDADAYAERGALYAESDYHEQAVADFDAALRADPYCVPAYQSLAWLLSTCPEARFRDAEKALESARRALRLGDAGDPLLLDTVAAAHAAAGRFEDAVRYQQQALLLAPGNLRGAFEQRLTRYRGGRPHRQTLRR